MMDIKTENEDIHYATLDYPRDLSACQRRYGQKCFKNFNVPDSLPEETGKGAVICMTLMVIPLDQKNKIFQ